MKFKNITILFTVITAFLLGCISYYVFLCFMGVVTAFMIDTGVMSFFIHTFIQPISRGDIRNLLLSGYFNATYITISLIILFLFTFFLSRYLSRKVLIYSVVLTLGALTTDLYYFRKMSFDSSYFFKEVHKIDFFNLLMWCICTAVSIKFAYYLKVRSANKNDQQVSKKEKHE